MYKNIILGFEFEVETSNVGNIHNFIDEMAPITGYTEHRVYGYHSLTSRTVEGKWRVEEDESIDGAEFISPPMPYIEAKEMVKKVFEIIKNSDNINITDNCGLHVGMSIDGTVENLNLSNFLVSLDQEYIAALWPKRIKNTYVRNVGMQLKGFRKTILKNINTENIAKYLFKACHSFITLKYFNFKKYLEVRVAGGENYHCKFKKLFALIDHVANNMLSNNLNTSKITNKKCTKKMTSYVNRALKDSNRIEFWPTKLVVKRLNSGTIFSPYAIEKILCPIESKIKHIYLGNKNDVCNILNEELYLYSLIKYCILYKEDYYGHRVYLMMRSFLKLVKNSEIHISIQKNDSISNKVKIFKHWQCLPTHLLINLLSSINNRHAYKYLTKYVSEGLQHTIDSDSEGILKRNAITHVFKYNKVN